MNNKLWLFAIATPFFSVFGCSPSDSTTKTQPINTAGITAPQATESNSDIATDSLKAQLFENMGNHKRTISTSSPEAQEYFNQGLIWMYAFNHDEAIRSFKKASELDPECAMAEWGASLAAGPQYNHAIMTENRIEIAQQAMEKAIQRIENTTAVERALIEALKQRNPDSENPEDWTRHTQAYADAMEKVWEAFPKDADVGSLFAEAMMVHIPWLLFTLDHQPHESTPKILATLKRVLELDPNHPGALHLYIHAVEPSGDPGEGLDAAERLGDLIFASGHLLHMPAHIYVKTGRWEQAITQSEKAMRADKLYRELSPEQLTQHVYMTHNAHMLAYAAMMTGRKEEALNAARNMWENAPEEALRIPAIDRWMCSVYDVQKRFGQWDDIINEPPPHEFMLLTTATWRAARAVAFAAKKDIASAQHEYEAFKKAKAAIPAGAPWARDDAHRVLEVSDYFIAGEIALQQDQWDKATMLLEQAAAVEDTLGYGEPPQWLQPVRHTLGVVHLRNNQFQDAERVYREDLAKWPNNGRSLLGLSQALEGQGKLEAAQEAMIKHQEIWAKADTSITSSCDCLPNN